MSSVQQLFVVYHDIDCNKVGEFAAFDQGTMQRMNKIGKFLIQCRTPVVVVADKGTGSQVLRGFVPDPKEYARLPAVEFWNEYSSSGGFSPKELMNGIGLLPENSVILLGAKVARILKFPENIINSIVIHKLPVRVRKIRTGCVSARLNEQRNVPTVGQISSTGASGQQEAIDVETKPLGDEEVQFAAEQVRMLRAQRSLERASKESEEQARKSTRSRITVVVLFLLLIVLVGVILAILGDVKP